MTRHYSVIAALVALATYGLHILGLFVVQNGLAFDLWLRARPTPVNSVLVVEVPHSGQERFDGAWGDVAKTLRDLGARKLVFTFNPFATSSLSPDLAGDDLVVGRFASRDEGDEAAWEFLEPQPPGGTAWGAEFLPQAEYGIHRRQATFITVDGATVPSLVVKAAAMAGSRNIPPADASFLLRFPGSADLIPRVELRRVLEGQVVRDLVAGRVVVVGQLGEASGVGLTTPMTPNSPATEPLHFTALGLETLLNGRSVRDMGPAPAALLLLATTMAGALLYSRLSPRRWPWAMGVALVAVALLTATVLETIGTLIPVAEILFSQILASILIWHFREAKQDRLLLSLLRQFPSGERRGGRDAAEQGDWRLLGAMTRRLLGLRRSLLLVPGKRPSRLEQAAAIGCSLADLPENRRDPRQWPYVDAARADEPVQVPSDFLTCTDKNELTYLAPLRRDDVVAGYWAFTVVPEEAPNAPNLLRALQAAADLLAEESAPAELKLDTPTRTVDSLLRSRLAALSRRSQVLDNILDELSTALVVFDRIGRVLHANARITALARVIGVHLDAITPTDLMTTFCGLPEDQGARMTRRVLLEGATTELPASIEVEGRRYLLRFSPLRAAQGGVLPDGLMCELLDVTDLVRLAQFQRIFVQHVGLQLRHDVATIQMAAALMADERLPKETGRRSWVLLQSAVERLIGRLAKVEVSLEEAGGATAAVALPVDPLLALKSALAVVGKVAEQKGVRLLAQRSTFAGLVLADALELQNLLDALLQILVQDARRGTEVSVTFEEGVTAVKLILQNDGLGMRDARLKAILNGEQEARTSEFRELREGAGAAERWGGRLAGEGRPGRGFRFAVIMPRFT